VKPIYLLVDGNNIASRAAHASWAASTMSSEDGTPTAALMFFINSIAKVVGEVQPTHVAVAWDGKSRYRHGLLPTYKANRKPMPDGQQREQISTFALMGGFLNAAGAHQRLHPEYEADDLIASWWWVIKEAQEIVILSGDKDLYQLLGKNPWGVETTARKPVGGGVYERWDRIDFQNKHGFYPSQWPVIGALTGDTSDNIDGIRGVGPKKALKLMRDHDWAFEHAVQAKYPEELEKVQRNRKLMSLRDENPVPQMINDIRRFARPMHGTPEGDLLDQFLARYELNQIQASYRNGTLWTASRPIGRPLRRSSATPEGRSTP
jgi:5'-3' exonuclease